MKKSEVSVIVATAVVIITICSTCSPLYVMNVSYDPNVFLTIGRSMLHGVMPYRDLFDHKGPLHYMLYALAALVSERTFFGVLLLEFVCGIGYLYWAFKTFVLCLGEERRRACLLLVPVVAVLTYTSRAFCEGAQGSEELLLPLSVYTFYVGLKALKEERMPSASECFWVGLCAGCAFWTKLILVGLYAGWYLFFAYKSLRHGRKADAGRILDWMVLGALVPTAVSIIFFAAVHALGDMFEVYFYDNLFHYANSKSQGPSFLALPQNLFSGFLNAFHYNLLAFVLLLVGIVLLVVTGYKRIFQYLLTTFIFCFLVIYGGQRQIYYSFVFFALMPFILCLEADKLVEWLRLRRWAKLPSFVARHKLVIVFACCLVYTLIFSPNVGNIGRSKSEYPQYQFAEIIKQKPNATLLSYDCMDNGFFLTTGIIPNLRFYFKTSACEEETEKAQKEYVDQRMVDFVIIPDWAKFQSDNYELVRMTTFERFPLHSLRGLVYKPNKFHKRTDIYSIYRLKEQK